MRQDVATGVHAWDLPKLPAINEVDRVKYRELTLRAVQEVLQPLGITDAILKNWVLDSRAGYLALPGYLKTSDTTRLALPLFADQKYLRLHT